MNDRAGRALNFALAALATWYALAFLYVALFSIGYPYGMEWLEGHVMEIVARAARGEPIYVAPSLDYVPFIYTPFYYIIASYFTQLFGVDFTAGRALSILSTLGIAGIIFLWARALGNKRLTAFSAAGLYLAAYHISGRWYDLARVDNLYVFLLLTGMFTLHTQRGIFAALIAAGFFAFAFYTKQSAIFAFAPLLCWAIFYYRRDGLTALAATAAAIALLVFTANSESAGWFRFYIFDVPAGHGLDKKYTFGFFTGDLLKHWFPMLLACIPLARNLYCSDRQQFFFFFALGLGLIGSSYIARIHWGGYVNVLLPMFAFFAITSSSAIASWPPTRLLVLLQFLLLWYSPNALIPNDALRENNDKAIAAITDVYGDVFVPELHFIDWPMGKRSYVYGMAAFDISRSENPRVAPVKEVMRLELEEAFTKNRFSAVMPGALLKLRESFENYSEERKLPYTFRYLTGLVRQQNPTVRTSTSCC